MAEGSNFLTGIMDFITVGANAAATVISAKDAKEIAEKANETKQKELEYLAAQEKKAMVQAAAEGARSVVNNETVKQIAIWTLTTIAGGVLVGVVMKMAGLSK